MEDVIIDVEGFESYAEMPEMKGTKIKLIPSEAIMREKMYSGIQNLSTYKKIAIVPEEKLKKVWQAFRKIVFYTSDKKYGATEVRFANEEPATAHGTTTLKTGVGVAANI